MLASSRATETSLVLRRERNSVFTTAMLSGLKGAATAASDGTIGFDLFNHVSETVRQSVPGRQHPVFKASDLEENFPVALALGGTKSISPGVNQRHRDLEQIMRGPLPARPDGPGHLAAGGGRRLAPQAERQRTSAVVRRAPPDLPGRWRQHFARERDRRGTGRIPCPPRAQGVALIRSAPGSAMSRSSQCRMPSAGRRKSSFRNGQANGAAGQYLLGKPRARLRRCSSVCRSAAATSLRGKRRDGGGTSSNHDTT